MGNEPELAVPLVSILIPVKNGALFLREAVFSCLEQEAAFDYEILLIDDHSTDATAEIIKELCSKYPAVHGLVNRGIGVGAALQTGLLAAVGDFIFRLDSDDRMFPNRLALQVTALLDNPHMVLCGSQIDLFAEGSIPYSANHYPISNDEICRFMQTGNAFADPSVAFRRESAILVGGFSTTLNGAEQYSLWLRMSKIGELHNLPQVLTNYRVHSNQFTKSKVAKVVIATVAVQSLWILGITQLRLRFKVGTRIELQSGVGRLHMISNIPKYLCHVFVAWIRS